MVEISRISNLMENSNFMQKVYSAAEISELEARGFPPQSAAAAFAAKEAFAKALGTGIRGFSLNEISLLHDELGAPRLELAGRAKEIAANSGLTFTVSLTHTKEYAAAVVVAFTPNL